MDTNVIDALITRRTEMQQECTDPDAWRALGQEFDKIGFYVNSEKCYELAKHFASVTG